MEHFFSVFSNSEANASELLLNIEEMCLVAQSIIMYHIVTCILWTFFQKSGCVIYTYNVGRGGHKSLKKYA